MNVTVREKVAQGVMKEKLMSYRAQWFDPIGKCQKCKRKAAQGILKSFTNENLGYYCERCANIEIKDGQQQRKNEVKSKGLIE